MVFGEERLFKTNVQLKYKFELYLRFLGEDSSGIKMRGVFPNLWRVNGTKVIGPQLVDEDHVYNISKIDYHKECVWLSPA